MATLNFDATNVEPAVGFEAIPAGKYQAVITDSEEKSTKSGNGSYIQLELEVIDGEFKGRKVWERLNLVNPNPKAVDFARAKLSAICRAVNVMQPKDSADLHNLPLMITVKCKKQDNGDISNDISDYSARQSSSAPANTTAGTSSEAPAAPWARAKKQ